MGAIFYYHAKDKNAQYKDGVIAAASENEALEKLEAQGLYVISIHSAETKSEKTTSGSTADKRKAKRILLIEDSAVILEVLRERLEKNNYKVIIAIDGKEGLSRAVEEKPDLILLDIILPNKSGFEVLGELKIKEATRKIPVIMLSSRSETSALFRCMELGAQDYIIKGEDEKVLLKIIEKWLEVRR